MPSPIPQYLVLGASGKLGREIVRQLDGEETLPQTREILDITDLAKVQKMIPLLKPAVVINAAGMTDWVRCERDRNECWAVNSQAVDNIVKTCALNGTPLIHVSTGEVFGLNPDKKLYCESDPVGATNHYSACKIAGENAILGLGQCMCPEFWKGNFRYWVIRTSELYEPYDAVTMTLANNVVNKLQRNTKRNPIRTSNDIIRSPTYIPHLAKSIVWLAKHNTEVVSGVYHIASRGGTSYYEFARELSLMVPNKGVGVEPQVAEEWARTNSFDPELIPRCAPLSCDKWHEIAPFEMPHWQEALAEYAQTVSSR